MATRTLIHVPDAPRRGEVVEIRVTLGHAMENGLRPDGYGNVVPRSLVTRFECRLDGTLVAAADLYPAIAANPYLAFWVRANGPGTLSFEWWGDWDFHHRETRAIQPA
ncbi:MAG: thiosulfate oxidation carrier complex protein SoxZ [Burkholderiales bacterium PBB5]|nr:MAG: thiosulfate oxidation carrier complex protein SoxZ [Burkholderiales bacterium PBB5]